MVRIMDLFGAGLLLWMSVSDWKTMQIPLTGLLLFLFAGFFRQLFYDAGGWIIALGLSLCILFLSLLARKVTSKGLGSGDVLLLMAIPFWKPGGRFLYCIAAAFGIAAFYGLIRYGIHERKQRIPFVPAMMISFSMTAIIM